ncbi:MAG TPA: hypothetical protein VFQ23_08070 [Anaerolineales bacterium]|nr:hypothetical protein [Anaerolineales bacterium]
MTQNQRPRQKSCFSTDEASRAHIEGRTWDEMPVNVGLVKA